MCKQVCSENWSAGIVVSVESWGKCSRSVSLSSGSKVAMFLPPGVLQLMIVNRAVTSVAKTGEITSCASEHSSHYELFS